jgi:hypothetical protein
MKSIGVDYIHPNGAIRHLSCSFSGFILMLEGGTVVKDYFFSLNETEYESHGFS